jgi:hypothetical protein
MSRFVVPGRIAVLVVADLIDEPPKSGHSLEQIKDDFNLQQFF